MDRRSFQDFDEFVDSVRGVDAGMMLQNPTNRLWSISAVELPGVHVQQGRLGSGNIVEGQSYSNGYLLYLPLTAACPYTANGRLLVPNSFMILEPGCDFCLSTPAEHDWLTLFVPTDRLARRSDASGLERGKTVCRVTGRNRFIAQRFRESLDAVLIAAAASSQFESSPAAQFAAAELLNVAHSVSRISLVNKPSRAGRPRVPRHGIIRRCKELLAQRRGQRVPLEDLVAAVGVSERTLRAAFHDYFGIGPMRYLQLRQLHQIYRALKAEDPTRVSVADVLVQHGEWNFGRFAARYRRLFGETPAQSLQRKFC